MNDEVCEFVCFLLMIETFSFEHVEHLNERTLLVGKNQCAERTTATRIDFLVVEYDFIGRFSIQPFALPGMILYSLQSI